MMASSTPGSNAPTPTAPAEWPDLVLSVRTSEKPRALFYELLQGIQDQRPLRYEKKLGQPPRAQLSAIVGQLDLLGKSLDGIGATLTKHFLPDNLKRQLRSFYQPGRPPEADAKTLWVISDEPFIPWELLRLGDDANQGPFLAEVFALSRWLYDEPVRRAAPLRHVALVMESESPLPQQRQERKVIESLRRAGEREVEVVEAALSKVVAAMGSNRFDGWHFIGRGATDEPAADLVGLMLDAEGGRFTVADLKSPGCNLRERRPMVFLNTCGSAQGKTALTGLGGLAQGFVQAGAAAVIGAQWKVNDEPAYQFAKAFYRFYLSGEPIAEAVRQARLWLRQEFPGDPTWLAYTVFAHPAAAVAGADDEHPPLRQDSRFLALPWHVWRPALSPGTLLRADHGIVPFHRREDELADLSAWCRNGQPLEVRLYTGPGGMGKTRLAIEMCRRMRLEGWRTGFVTPSADRKSEAAIQELSRGEGPLLAVVDYAETRRALLVPLLRELLSVANGEPLRVILLSRWREEWWQQLKREGERVGDLIAGRATQHLVLEPLASALERRQETFEIAARSFAEVLEKPIPTEPPADLEADHFKPVLMIHISALSAVEGTPMKGEDGILDWILNREKRFWEKQAEQRRLPAELFAGIGRAMCAISLGGGTVSKKGTLRLLEALNVFNGQPNAVLNSLAQLLHETYPGDRWVMPLLPDILAEHLFERELQEDPQEVFDLVLGARNLTG